MKNKMTSFIRHNKGFFIFLFVLFVFRGAIADWHPVPTGSMKPTILEGDIILVNKLAYDLQIPFTEISLTHLGEPRRGDIVVFTSKKAGKRLIKRLIGEPGDTIELRNNQLFINGLAANYQQDTDHIISPKRKVDQESGIYLRESLPGELPEHFIQIKPIRRSPMQSFAPIKVPAGHFFFMGDNRDNSGDSRVFGFIPRSEIRGKATHILGSANLNDHYKLRTERFWKSLTHVSYHEAE
jgi:signal peptidase I